MPADPVRSALVARIQSVPGIGIVHAYERYELKAEKLAALYSDADGRLFGWHVRRVALREVSQALGASIEDTDWQITGYRQVVDAEASELAFDALIDSLRAAFQSDESLGGTVATTVVEDRLGLQLDESGLFLFAGVVCHAAQLSLTTRRYLRP